MAIVLGGNAYTTLVAFKAWAALRDFDLSAYADLKIEAAIVVSSLDYIEPNYVFIGTKSTTTQLMSLPTTLVTIPDIENPVCYVVYQYLQGNLFIDAADITNAEIVSVSSKLGPLTKSTEFRAGSRATYVKPTQKIDRLFNKFVTSSGFGLVVRRG